MKRKILPIILILLTLVNIFAPFSVGLNSQNTPEVKTNVAEAAECDFVQNGSKFNPHGQQQAKWIQGNPRVSLTVSTKNCTGGELSIVLTEESGVNSPVFGTLAHQLIKGDESIFTFVPGEIECTNKDLNGCQIGFKIGLDKQGMSQKTYNSSSVDIDELYFKCRLDTCNKSLWKLVSAEGGTPQTAAEIQDPAGADRSAAYQAALKNLAEACKDSSSQACADAKKAVEDTHAEVVKFRGNNSADNLPDCNPVPFVGGGTLMGCIAQGIYYVLFVPTSYLFALTGQLFDWAFHYTVSDTAYRSPFVVQGWGLVRDFCNLFFIFVLLYVAISTTLSIHGFKTKEMIINVVVIGLLMNFSLFAAQVIIDTSNILARSIYNSDAIKITNNGANCMTDKTDPKCLDLGQGIDTRPGGIIPLSAALVNKVNPQNLITDGRKAVYIEDKVTGTQSNSTDKGNLGTGAFILVTFLAIAVNIVGMIAFLSIALMCFTRVVGLWLYMIFAPLAFFSYTVPQMKGMKTIGWKNWWSQLMCYSFWAPLLVFFIYIILKFLDTGLGLIDAAGKTGTAFVIATTVPFIFIMVLLMKAKGLAKSMGCEMAEQITGGVAAVGAVALGGAALGSAAILRGTVGATAKYVQNDNARTKDSKLNSIVPKGILNKANPFAWAGGIRKFATANAARPLAAIGREKDSTGKVTKKGILQRSEEALRDKSHAKSSLDTAAATVSHDKEMTYDKLTEPEAEKARTIVNQNELAKSVLGVKFDDIKDPAHKLIVRDSVDDYMKGGEKHGDLKTNQEIVMRDSAGVAVRTVAKGTSLSSGGHDASHMAGLLTVNQALGELSSALRKGSMDIRNASQMKSSSKGFPKFAVGLLAAVAAGTRMGFKQSGINQGTGQKDFIKDLGNTIKEALAGVHIKVDAGGGGGHAKKDDHGGGGGGH